MFRRWTLPYECTKWRKLFEMQAVTSLWFGFARGCMTMFLWFSSSAPKTQKKLLPRCTNGRFKLASIQENLIFSCSNRRVKRFKCELESHVHWKLLMWTKGWSQACSSYTCFWKVKDGHSENHQIWLRGNWSAVQLIYNGSFSFRGDSGIAWRFWTSANFRSTSQRSSMDNLKLTTKPFFDLRHEDIILAMMCLSWLRKSTLGMISQFSNLPPSPYSLILKSIVGHTTKLIASLHCHWHFRFHCLQSNIWQYKYQ